MCLRAATASWQHRVAIPCLHLLFHTGLEITTESSRSLCFTHSSRHSNPNHIHSYSGGRLIVPFIPNIRIVSHTIQRKSTLWGQRPRFSICRRVIPQHFPTANPVNTPLPSPPPSPKPSRFMQLENVLKFSGTQEDKKQPTDFLKAIKWAFLTNGTMAEDQKISLFELYLKSESPAEEWYNDRGTPKKSGSS